MGADDLLGLLFALCAVAAAGFQRARRPAVRQAASLIPLRVLHRVTDALTEAVRRYATHHRERARGIVMSVIVQVIRVLQAWCLGRALGLELPLALYFAFIPVIVLIMQLPISVNGRPCNTDRLNGT